MLSSVVKANTEVDVVSLVATLKRECTRLRTALQASTREVEMLKAKQLTDAQHEVCNF